MAHHHHHDHNQVESEGASFTERNRTHWDKQASTYMSDHFQKEFGDLVNKITAFVLSNISWIGVDFLIPASTFEKDSSDSPDRIVRVLDYACGPGTMTNALAGYASEFVGIDLSENMVKEYNKRFSPPSWPRPGNRTQLKASANVGNLLGLEEDTTTFAGPEFTDFDLVVVGLGFHHFENLAEVTKRLVSRVKPGGIFLIVDFLPHAANDLGDIDKARMIAHHGFSTDRVRQLFSDAGLMDIDFRIMSEPVMLRGKAPRTPFLARGRKPI